MCPHDGVSTSDTVRKVQCAHIFKKFPQFLVTHTVKGFSHAFYRRSPFGLMCIFLSMSYFPCLLPSLPNIFYNSLI